MVEHLAGSKLSSMDIDPGQALCVYEGVVEFEDLDTWPPELLALFEREFPSLEAYERRRAEVDALCRDDVMARMSPPPNAHKQRRDEVIRQADTTIAGNKLLGFHCTRLRTFELEQVMSCGLRLLDTALLQDRIGRAVAEGELTPDLAKLLLDSHQAEDIGRPGMIHFVNCRSFLKDEDDVGRLFRSWGGEALYNSHEGRQDTGPVLRRIGEPAIVVAAIPISKLRTAAGTIGERFVWKFLADREVPIDQAPDIETLATEPVPAAMILDIIRFADRRFEKLTRSSKWREPVG